MEDYIKCELNGGGFLDIQAPFLTCLLLLYTTYKATHAM